MKLVAILSRVRIPTTGRALLPGLAMLMVALSSALGPTAATAQEIDLQLQEIRTLVREKRYPLALESLRLVARQIQDLRLEILAPAFPAAPSGWTALPAMSLLEEDDIWSSRVVAQRAYVASTGGAPARMDLTVDVHSPHAATVGMSLNPVIVAGDPLARVVEAGGEKALVRFNADSGDCDIRLLVGKEILLSARARGVGSADVLLDLIRRVDFQALRQKSGI